MKKVIDVFATSASADYADEYIMPVWSVDMWGDTAYVVNAPSPWVMVTNPTSNSMAKTLEVGDLVRIGKPNLNAGFTDYMTVLERRKVNAIGSLCTEDLVWDYTDDQTLPKAVHLTTKALRILTGLTTRTITATTYAYRVSASVNATEPPITIEVMGRDEERGTALKNRHNLSLSSLVNYDISTGQDPTQVYPLFRMRTPPPYVKVHWDRGVKQVHWIKLVGASLFNKRQAGFESQHEFHNDDYLVVHVDEISGETISNSEHVRGAFAVLHAGTASDTDTGAVEVHMHEPQGLVEHHFERPRTDLHGMTLRFKDARGGDAHFGRIHLWFKLCVSHG